MGSRSIWYTRSGRRSWLNLKSSVLHGVHPRSQWYFCVSWTQGIFVYWYNLFNRGGVGTIGLTEGEIIQFFNRGGDGTIGFTEEEIV